MLRGKFFKLGALVPAVVLTLAGVAHAQLVGPKMLQAYGDTMDSNSDHGHMALAGWMTLTPKGGAKAVHVTLTYQDSYIDGLDGLVCTFTQPGDVSYSFPNGLNSAGTLTLTLSNNDPACFRVTGAGTTPEADKTVTFNIYWRAGSLVLVGVGTTLEDAGGNVIKSPIAVSGTLMTAAGIAGNKLLGVRLFNALGGTNYNNGFGSTGHMAIAGRATLNAKGGANALDLTLSYVDSQADNFTCELTNPSVLSYNLTKGVGTLTLTNINGCQIGGDVSITFNLYVVGSQARIVATSLFLFGTAATSVAMSGAL